MMVSTIPVIVAYCIQVTLATKCYKDKELGDREGNIYHCTTDDLPRCCVKEGGPTCCLDETDKNVTEQLQLWGTVAGMLLLIAILFVCCKNDISFCKSEMSLKERWNNYRNKKKGGHQRMADEKVGGHGGQYYDNPIGEFKKDGGHGLDPYHYPSLPRKDSM